MTDVRISRACNAARRQGKLDGLREAARALCSECRAGHVPEQQERL